MPGTVLGQGSSLKKENKMSALQVVANKSKEKADYGCESDSDSNYACEAPDFDEELGSACSRPSGKRNGGTGLYSGKTDAGSSRFDNVVILAGRRCKKRKTKRLNPLNASTVHLTASKPCSATTLPSSPLVPQESKNNSVDSGPLDVCCDVHKADREEAAHVEDNEKVTPSCSSDSIQPAAPAPLLCSNCFLKDVKEKLNAAEVAAVMPVRRTQNVWIIGDSWIFWLWKHALKSHVEKNLNLPDKNIFWFPGKEKRLWKTVVPLLKSTVGVPLPDILVLHCGADDLVCNRTFNITSGMRYDILNIMWMFPKLKIVFSCIAQRKYWKRKSEKARRIVNNYITAFLREHQMFSIDHNNIMFYDDRLFLPDGVHLSSVGNSIFMQNICDTLQNLN
ncbi:uncharacterized protein LOC144817738 isoform X2 [Lissotriton helveticus]